MKRLLIGLCVVAATQSASAQTTQYGPLAFRLSASARMLAMADLGVIDRDDDVVFYNPAQLSVARGTSVSFARMSPEIYGGTMSTNLRLGPGGVGIGVNYLEYRTPFALYPISRSDILKSSPALPPGSSTQAVIGYSQVIRGLRVGVSANYGVDEIGLDRFRNVAADIGLAKDFNRFTTALSLQHLGVGMRSDNSLGIGQDSVRLPMKATLGAGWSGSAGPLDVVGALGVSAMREGHVSPGAGGEVSWSWLSGYAISGRFGVRYPANVDDAKYTAGFGFVADRTSIDFAAEVMPNDRVGYRAGIRIR